MTTSSAPDTQTTDRASGRIEERLLQVVFVGAVLLSCFQLWQAVTGTLGATLFRPIHLTAIVALTFLYHPVVPPSDSTRYRLGRALDLALTLATLYCGYVIGNFDYSGIRHILEGLSLHDLLSGAVYLLLVLEATRRTVGWVMVAIGGTFLLYNAFGNLLPDILANRGFGFERIIRFQIFTGAGLFGAPLGIAAGTVFLFVLFGAFLEVTGAGRFFIDLAFAAAGRYRGGPAKASVLASAAMGSISGSAIANTVTTGALTIPMMKKLGYKPEQAAGIEAAASTGGQIMPPIMGAGAFIMAEFTNTPYNDIVVISVVPALLFFACTLLFVHIMAAKRGLTGIPDTPALRSTLRAGYHFLVPLVAVTVLLLMNYSPPLVGAIGCGAVVLTGALRRGTRVGLTTVIRGLERGALMALPISAACATAGIVVGVIGQTGIGLQFTEVVVQLASGELWLALILVALAALILGMGLPVTAAYIVISVMAAPALRDLGLNLVVAHMILFWLSQTSNVTPPIALAAFAGAGIAGARPMRAAIEALKLAAGYFIIPVMMAYSPLLHVEGVSWGQTAFASLLTMSVVAATAFAVEGHWSGRATFLERVWQVAAIGLVIHPSTATRFVGLAFVVLGLLFHVARVKRSGSS
jgi:TRAP transporter 4TM/12TM fusion protein